MEIKVELHEKDGTVTTTRHTIDTDVTNINITKTIEPIVSSDVTLWATTENRSYLHGELLLDNNPWNSSAVDSLGLPGHQYYMLKSLNPLSIKLDWAWPETDGGVKGFPCIIFGRNPWRNSSTTTKLPAKLSTLGSILATFDTKSTCTPVSHMNTAFDIFINPSNIPDPTKNLEVMIWTAGHANGPKDTYTGQTTIKIDGLQYLFYRSASYIRFKALVPMETGALRIDSFLKYLTTNGYCLATNYLSSIEFGNEYMGGSGHTDINSYSITM